MSGLRWLVGLLAVALLAGCDTVTVDKPFGDKPAAALDAREWEGHWHIDDDVWKVRVVDAGEGILEMAAIAESGGSQAIQTTRIHLRQAGGWKFLFLAPEKAGEGYTWYKYENLEGKMVLLWQPSIERCRAAVEQGLLRGDVLKEAVPSPEGSPFRDSSVSKVALREIGAKEISLLTSEEKGLFVDWRHPLPVLRVGE